MALSVETEWHRTLKIFATRSYDILHSRSHSPLPLTA
jgi:hypothetical protein